jgi:hypothetical protein
MMDAVGTIEVERATAAGSWEPAGSFREPGPIASDVTVVPIGAGRGAEPVRLRLRMARGAWRIGYLALATLGDPVTPVAVGPVRVLRDGQPDSLALVRLHDPRRYLVTYPGDRYRIEFALPDVDAGVDLFLESRGFYYEWMRPEWVAEEDPAMLALIGTNPREALRRLAPEFKRREPELEHRFWASRFGRE